MRRTEKLVIPGVRSENPGDRDNGKIFLLTEMDAYSGQDWALRALLALGATGVEIPDNALASGFSGLARVGVAALLKAPAPTIRALLDEMMAQAKYVHVDTKGKETPPQPILTGPNCQIEEIKTFLIIQLALFKLHTGFSPTAATPT